MGRLNWEQEINFASALLLHSCTTVLIKEFCNLVVFFHRLSLRRRDLYGVSSSFVLDGFTSILSGDPDGALSELYFTNTGIGLLAVSLASSIAMNLLLSPLVLNITVTSTFAVTWIASLLVLRWRPVMPILALRRAGRFVWSDTPIVNFFSLTYIATVRSGDSTLQLKDYMIFRSIAIVELVFMKTLLAASSMEEQQTMVHNLTASEKVFIRARVNTGSTSATQCLERPSIVAFTTRQRMGVMFFKTSPGHDSGSVRGREGPLLIPAPPPGTYVDETSHGWKMYRFSEDIMIIVDNLQATPANGIWLRFIAQAHGVILRQLGKVRVVYLRKETRRTGSKTEDV